MTCDVKMRVFLQVFSLFFFHCFFLNFDSRYDHLVSILSKVLDKEPENAVEMLKEFSRKEHKARFVAEKDTIEGRNEVPKDFILANEQKNLFDVSIMIVYIKETR